MNTALGIFTVRGGPGGLPPVRPSLENQQYTIRD